MWLACSVGLENIVGYLLEQPGIDVDSGTSHIPLHTAAYHNYVGIVQRLLRAGCDVNKVGTVTILCGLICLGFNAIHVLT